MKFYCEYCKSYLTHDKLSVRKSHLQGKTHIKLYCQYFEHQQKSLDIPYDDDIDLEYVYENSPKVGDLGSNEFHLPPPEPVKGMPKPPASLMHNEKDKASIVYYNNYKEQQRFK